MIDGIRRRFNKSFDKDPWDADQELEPEVEEASELPTDTQVLIAATQKAAPPANNDVNTSDYYKSLVKTAIANGGRYGDQEIPVPWLRMILAGLEMRYIEPETMWYGVDASSPSDVSITEIPQYNDLFPSERDSVGPELNQP